jgi:small-conductance mechanosensitive channel
MRNAILFILIAMFGCSSPKYTYHFDHYDYNSGRKDIRVAQPPTVTASASPVVPDFKAYTTLPEKEDDTVEPQKKLTKEKKISRGEKKQLQSQLKAYVKEIKQQKKKGDDGTTASKVMDNDLKLAIIFGAVGLTLTLFGGVSSALYVLGVIGIVIGVVFLIKWVVRQ